MEQKTKKTLNTALEGLISNHPSPEPKVEQLWKKWTLGQKAKWCFYNKFPLIRDTSEEIRKAIDSYNEAAYLLNELNTEGDADSYVQYKQYPDHLTPNPKLIYVTDIFIRPNASIDFVTMDITLNPEND